MTFNPVAKDSNYVLYTASEPVHGLDSSSVRFIDDTDGDHPVDMPGTWQCTDNRNHIVDCDQGPVLFARYTLDSGTWVTNHKYEAVIDQGTDQSFTDFAGNPCVGYGCEAGFGYYL